MADTPPQQRRRGGCLVWLGVFLLFAVVGYGAARLIRGNDDQGLSKTVTLTTGKAGSETWELKAVVDEQNDQCVFLYVGSDQVTGGCDYVASRAWVANQTIVLGKAPSNAVTAQVRLDDGTNVRVKTRPTDALDARWFTYQTRGRHELASEVLFYDAAGSVVTP